MEMKMRVRVGGWLAASEALALTAVSICRWEACSFELPLASGGRSLSVSQPHSSLHQLPLSHLERSQNGQASIGHHQLLSTD